MKSKLKEQQVTNKKGRSIILMDTTHDYTDEIDKIIK